jgi:hypothetical protein
LALTERHPAHANRFDPAPKHELDFFDDIHSLTRVGRPVAARERSIDVAIAELAGLQHGVVARWQLTQLGLGQGAIQHRLSTARLHRVFRGVFAVGHTCLTVHGRWTAAVLTSGAGALLSHRSAAALWGITPYAGTDIEVTVPGARRSRRTGIRMHGNLVQPDDQARQNGIPVTSIPCTLLDLAAVVSPQRLERAVEEAERLQLFDLAALERLCQRNVGRRGVRRLQAILDHVRPIPDTRSELERSFIAACDRAQLPRPAINCWVNGFEVDAVWEEARLVVELDGYAYHKSRRSFESDRARDVDLLLGGYRVVRVTARRLRDDPDAVVSTVRRLLAS